MYRRFLEATTIRTRLALALVSALAIVLLASQQGLAQSFDPRLDLTVGTAPLGVGIGDLDGDGKPDLVVSAHEDDTVAILRNTGGSGSLSFAAKLDFRTGLHPQGVTVIDLDGDGKPEIVTANSGRGGGGSISVLRNTSLPGVISFATRVDFPVDTAHRVAGGDLDGDGRVDLAVSANSPRKIAVFRNLSVPGSVSLSRIVNLATASFPNSVAIADVDGDENPDVLAPIGDIDVVSIYLNQSTASSISFFPRADFPVSDAPDGIGVEDFNGDGKNDVVVGSGRSDFVSLLVNGSVVGNLSFTRADFFAGSRPRELAVGDIDGIGKPDIVAVNSDNTLALLLTSSAAGSVSLDLVGKLEAVATPAIPNVGDFDGDGALDIVVSNHGGNTASVFRASSAGFLSFPLPDLGPFRAPVSAILDHSIATGYYCRDMHVRDDGCVPPLPRSCGRSRTARPCLMGGDGIVKAFTGVEAKSEFLVGTECGAQCTKARENCGAALTSCGYPRTSRELFTNEELGGIQYVGVATLGGRLFLQYDGHSGYDYSVPRGTAILAPADGQLLHVNRGEDAINGDGSRFNTFKIVHPERSGFIYETWFLHAERKSVAEEGEVKEGQKIAEVGCTGLERGAVCPAHLHFEVRRYRETSEPLGDFEIVDPYEEGLWKGD